MQIAPAAFSREEDNFRSGRRRHSLISLRWRVLLAILILSPSFSPSGIFPCHPDTTGTPFSTSGR